MSQSKCPEDSTRETDRRIKERIIGHNKRDENSKHTKTLPCRRWTKILKDWETLSLNSQRID